MSRFEKQDLEQKIKDLEDEIENHILTIDRLEEHVERLEEDIDNSKAGIEKLYNEFG